MNNKKKYLAIDGEKKQSPSILHIGNGHPILLLK